MTRMHVSELWRYPVKSLRGEPLAHAALGADGVQGDRLVHVRGNRGLLTGRTRSQLLRLRATTGPDGRPYVDGHPWGSPQAADLIRAAAGPDARLDHHPGPERFDVLPLLIATDAEINRLGHDGRRLRPNLVIAGTRAAEERSWQGRALHIGDAVVGVHSLRPRCIVTTIDPDTGAQDIDVLRSINRRFDGMIALNCWVITPAIVHVGADVDVLEGAPAEPPPHVGGWVTGAPNQPMPGTGIGSLAFPPRSATFAAPILMSSTSKYTRAPCLPGSMFVIAAPCCSPRRVMWYSDGPG